MIVASNTPNTRVVCLYTHAWVTSRHCDLLHLSHSYPPKSFDTTHIHTYAHTQFILLSISHTHSSAHSFQQDPQLLFPFFFLPQDASLQTTPKKP